MGSAALPFFKHLMALMISALVGGFVLMGSCSSAGDMSAIVVEGASIIKLFSPTFSLSYLVPSLSFTGLLGFVFFFSPTGTL
jgi:hypothetical protein